MGGLAYPAEVKQDVCLELLFVLVTARFLDPSLNFVVQFLDRTVGQAMIEKGSRPAPDAASAAFRNPEPASVAGTADIPTPIRGTLSSTSTSPLSPCKVTCLTWHCFTNPKIC
jgi:hypothetical protein